MSIEKKMKLWLISLRCTYYSCLRYFLLNFIQF